MLEGLYTAAAGMAAQQQRMDALSNDVANTNTAGYKRVRIGFRDLVYQADGPSGVRTGSGAAAVQVGRGFEQGAFQKTDLKEHGFLPSAMPSFRGRLAAQEVADVVAYLLSLRGQR